MPTRILTLILLPLILLALVACSSDVPEGIFQCDVDDDCPDDHVCETEARRCYSRGFDTSVCGPGFHARGGECIDNDECERADRCGVGGTCTNEEGAFDCACNETSEPTYPGPGCRDVDECRYGADRCSAYATCTDVVGSFSCTCETGFQGDGIDCDRTCNLSAESDIGSRSFAITHFGIADSGFELDGLDSSDTGTAVQPYECRAWPDMTGGLDNELDRIGSYDEMPLHTGLQAAITAGTLSIAVNLDFLASGAGADDPCVGVTITTNVGTYGGVGAIVDDVFEGEFAQPVEFDVSLRPPDSNCPGPCVAADLRMRVQAARIRLLLDPSGTEILPGSMFGGFDFVVEIVDSGTTWDYFNGDGFDTRMRAWADAVGPNFHTRFDYYRESLMRQYLDLRMSDSGRIEPCDWAPSALSSTNRNSVSMAFSLDSM
ncbi:MAG: hypothetical protein IPL19_10800 [Sandaracinaceae bacterium]|nr:hypothetical protein [Sandaracinaceae bacterium]MBK8408455.1 hypothetical protein [Sandaracinaceae bacterium]